MTNEERTIVVEGQNDKPNPFKCSYDGDRHFPVQGHSTIVYCGQCGDILKEADEDPTEELINFLMDEFLVAKEEVLQWINDEAYELD